MEDKDNKPPLCYCNVCEKNIRYSSIKTHVNGFNHKCATIIYNKKNSKELTINANDTIDMQEDLVNKWLEHVKAKSREYGMKHTRIRKHDICETCGVTFMDNYLSKHLKTRKHKLNTEIKEYLTKEELPDK